VGLVLAQAPPAKATPDGTPAREGSVARGPWAVLLVLAVAAAAVAGRLLF
jgi:hypothetical protein